MRKSGTIWQGVVDRPVCFEDLMVVAVSYYFIWISISYLTANSCWILFICFSSEGLKFRKSGYFLFVFKILIPVYAVMKTSLFKIQLVAHSRPKKNSIYLFIYLHSPIKRPGFSSSDTTKFRV
ncbi:hypothetical protein ACOSQ4_017722 [Xanthoceras sorbifolium]